MADVTMPQLGETVTEGTITKWFKQVGDKVDPDEVLFEVSTDKVDSEVPSPAGGASRARAGGRSVTTGGRARRVRSPRDGGSRGRRQPGRRRGGRVLEHPQAHGRAHGSLASDVGPRADRRRGGLRECRPRAA